MFNIDEEVLRHHDSTFTGVGDTKDVDPEVLHSVLKFIEMNTEDCIDSVHIDTDMKDSFGVETSTDGNKYDVPDTVGTLLHLKQIGDGIREQCKMIADVMYNMEDAETGNIILSQLCDVYNYFYKNCQNHKGILGVCKDNLKFRTLTGKRKNKGFFRWRRIIPLFPLKYRKQKASKFGRKSTYSGNTTLDDVHTTTSDDWLGTTSDEMSSIPTSTVHITSSDNDMDTELSDFSPFVNLEAYKGQDDLESR